MGVVIMVAVGMRGKIYYRPRNSSICGTNFKLKCTKHRYQLVKWGNMELVSFFFCPIWK
uniref:Uncharacterized protein n=1 Tax=Ciona intestinalis TaxID=7719 RepID=F7BHK7_CIOIN